MKTAQLRSSMQWIHLRDAVAISTYVSARWHDLSWFALPLQLMVIPGLGLTGLWLWEGHLLRRKAAIRSLPVNLINS